MAKHSLEILSVTKLDSYSMYCWEAEVKYNDGKTQKVTWDDCIYQEHLLLIQLASLIPDQKVFDDIKDKLESLISVNRMDADAEARSED